MEKNKQRILIYAAAGVIGLLAGLAGAYLYMKNQEDSAENYSGITSKDSLKLGVSLASILKQVAELGK